MVPVVAVVGVELQHLRLRHDRRRHRGRRHPLHQVQHLLRLQLRAPLPLERLLVVQPLRLVHPPRRVRRPHHHDLRHLRLRHDLHPPVLRLAGPEGQRP